MRRFVFESRDVRLEFVINEVVNEELQSFLWPCSLVMSCYLIQNIDSFKHKKFLEIGAGVGLPSLVAGKIGAKKCIITDRAEEEKVILNIKRNITENLLDSVCSAYAINWGYNIVENLEEKMKEACDIDYLIGSDVFYTTESFDEILLTYMALLKVNPSLIFYTTYQQRSVNRSLLPYLDQYNLQAILIPIPHFLNACHQDGSVRLMHSDSDGSHAMQAVDIQTFDDIYMIKIVPNVI